MASSSSSSGISLLGVVFVVFLVLKLIGIITWSWWWITAPLWGPVALAAIFILVTCAIALFVQAFE